MYSEGGSPTDIATAKASDAGRTHSHSYSSGGETIVAIPENYEPEKSEHSFQLEEPIDNPVSTEDLKQNSKQWNVLQALWPRRRGAEPDRDLEETETRSLEACPEGYPQVAAFLSSEPNFSQYRGFSYLHSRCLLDLQHEIQTLEKELDVLDEKDGETDAGNSKLQCRERDERESKKAEASVRTRRRILDDIRQKLVSYDDILIRARKLLGFQRPSQRDYGSLRAYFVNESPLSGDEEAWIRQKEDILTLRHGREWAHFDGWVERQLNRLKCFSFVKNAFTTPELRAKTKNTNIHYFSESRVHKLTSILITVVVFILLVLPVVAMYRLTSFGKKSTTFDAVGILIVFTLLFSAAMSLLTKAARHELFAASAAYCAVLVVFISNFGNGSSLSK